MPYKDPEKARACLLRYREEHREELLANDRVYYAEHREARRASARVYAAEHREEARIKTANWRRENPTRMKANNVKKYGISLEAYEAILAKPCAICKGKATELDHDHKTGRIRGGLCRLCNSGLGFFKDNPDNLITAAGYIL